MESSAILYLLIAMTHILPLWVIMCSIINASPFSFLHCRLIAAMRRERFFSFPRLDRIFHVNDKPMRKYVSRYAVVACSFHALTIVAFAFFLHYDIDVPLFPKLSALLPEILFDVYTKLSIACIILQTLPIFTLLYALYKKKHLPFMPPYVEERQVTKSELNRLEKHATPFGHIHLSRFDNLRKTIVFANCKDHRFNKVFKLALCKEKSVFENTDCFLVGERARGLRKIDPTPFYVDDLLKTFDKFNE